MSTGKIIFYWFSGVIALFVLAGKTGNDAAAYIFVLSAALLFWYVLFVAVRGVFRVIGRGVDMVAMKEREMKYRDRELREKYGDK